MTSLFTIIEIGLLIIIIIFQIRYFKETRRAIGNLKSFLPSINNLKIEKLNISSSDLAKSDPKEIIDSFSSFKEDEDDYLDSEDDFNLFNKDTTELNLISPDKKFYTSFDAVKNSLNIYLIKNKGSVADFNVIKDVIERNVEAEDEYISQTINTPLYLGLMGTMLGIIFGLFNLYFIQGSGQDIFDKGISSFLISVTIAMIASFLGLLLTVVNSVFGYKDAHKIIEKNKNDLYTLIQTELMPLINQSVASSVSTLKDVLIKFNSDFGSNLGRLDNLFTKNYQTIQAQSTILSSLESIDVNNFAKANVKVLKELRESLPYLEKFNETLNSSDRMLASTENLSRELNNILSRTNQFSDIIKSFDSRMNETKSIMEYMQTHVSKFEASDDLLMKWVRKADDSMTRTVTEYQKLIDAQKEGIKHMTMKESELLERTFEENRSYFSNLKFLEELNTSNKDLLEQVNSIEKIKTELEALKIMFDRTNSSLEKNNSLVKTSTDKLEETKQTIVNTAKNLETIPDTIKVNIVSEIFKNPFKKRNGKKIG